MIPKVIHYCWFGSSELPEKVQKNIQSWRETNPSYKIIRWDESNFDYKHVPFCLSAYDERLYAFVSDYARLSVVNEFGGFYLDTDVKLLKSLDSLRTNEVFFGLEDRDAINSGLLFGAEKGNHVINDLKSIYLNLGSNLQDGRFVKNSCVKITTSYFKNKGFRYRDKTQIIDNCKIYASKYFCPQKYGELRPQLTKDAFSVHQYSGTWIDDQNELLRMKHARMERRIKHVIGVTIYDWLYRKYKKE